MPDNLLSIYTSDSLFYPSIFLSIFLSFFLSFFFSFFSFPLLAYMPLFFCLSVCRSIFLFNNLSAKPIDLSILLYSFLQLSFLVLALNLFIQLKCGEEFNDYISIPGRHVLKPSQPQQIIQTCVLSLNNTQMCSIFKNNTACVLNLNK